MKYSVVIPCGGVGSRLNLGYNKILYRINDKYLIEKTIKNFLLDNDCLEIVIVYQKNDLKLLKSLLHDEKVKLVEGGDTRANSVLNGLKSASNEYVLIHDGARPNITKDLIEKIKISLISNECVIPVVKCKDASLIDKEYHQKEVLLIQTPQGFKKDLLLTAMDHLEIESFRDEGSIMAYYYKNNPYLVEGDYNNIKVTTIEDLKYIEED